MAEITLGRYYPASSVIHRLDPRIKATLLLIYIIEVFLAADFVGLGLLVALLAVTAVLSRVPATVMLKAAAPLAFLLIFPLLFNFFFVASGTPLLHYGPILVTDDGIWRGLYMTLRLGMLFFAATLLMLTTSSIALCDATASMLDPFRRFGVPAYEISMMVSIALRFVPTLMSDYEHIRKAQMARGADLGSGGPLRRLRAIVPLMVPLFVQSFRHAEDLAYAMESRCYHGGTNRTHYHILKVERRDYIAVAVTLAMSAVLIVMLAA